MTSYQIIASINLSKIIKKKVPDVPVVWGGVHPSLCANQTIKQKYIDFIVVGEGEKTFLELANFLKNKKADLWRIDGLVWKKKGKIVVNKPRRFMDYNEAAFAYEGKGKKVLWKYLKKDTHIKSIRPVFYQTSRGCPYNCAFCYNKAFNNGKWRPRSLNLVRNELGKLKRWGIEEVSFCDDGMGTSKKRLSGINKITKDLGIKWSGVLRVNQIDERIAKELEESGCQYIFFGIESGNQETLNYLNKMTNVKQIKRCVKAMAKTSIVPAYSFVFGFPNEPRGHIKDSFELVDWILDVDKKANIALQVYAPTPGSDLYSAAVDEGLKEPEKMEDWAKMVAHEVNTPWARNKTFLKNIYVISLLAFRYEELLKKRIFYIPHKIARWRWKHKFFKFSYERVLFDLAKKLTKFYYRIN